MRMTRRNRRHDESAAPMHNRRPEPDRNPIHGPTPADIGEAMHELVEKPATEVPDVSTIKLLNDAGINFPVTVGDRRILSASITRGQPQHGAMSSYDHIGSYEVEYPKPCPEDECMSQVTRYKYSAHHNISGCESTYCPRCEAEHERKEWH